MTAMTHPDAPSPDLERIDVGAFNLAMEAGREAFLASKYSLVSRNVDAALEAAIRSALASARSIQAEPVAWQWRVSPNQKNWLYSETDPRPVHGSGCYDVQPLYAHPPAPPSGEVVAVEPPPMTSERVEALNRWYIQRREDDIAATRAEIFKLQVAEHPSHCNRHIKGSCSCGIAETLDGLRAHLNGMVGPETQYSVPEHGWTCFHCGETFKTVEAAERHFGQPWNIRPECFTAALVPSTVKSGAGEARKGIYIASKVAHARRWRILRDKIGYPIISSWIDEAGPGQSQDLADLWARCISEASSAEVLVFNAEPGELFKGAWVELGAALANGVPVLAVGLNKIEGLTIAHDKRIKHFDTMAEVTAFLKPMVSGARFRALHAKPEENGKL